MRKPTVWMALVVATAVTTMALQQETHAQTEPEKRPGPAPAHGPKEPPPPAPAAGPVGAPVTVDMSALTAEADSTMRHMDLLMKQSFALSTSFGEMARLHHGADRSEILMMQRVSDAMGAMAAELKGTLTQYKLMLDDETSSETGAMKSEVDGLHATMQVIAGEVTDAIQTLHRLEAQLGQG